MSQIVVVSLFFIFLFIFILYTVGAEEVSASDGKTVAMQAAQNDDLELLTYLIDKSAMMKLDVHSLDRSGWNCLYYSILCSSFSFLNYLLLH